MCGHQRFSDASQVSLILATPLFDDFVSGFEEVLIEPQYAMVGILLFFAAVHSGLAYLRPYGARSATQFYPPLTGVDLHGRAWQADTRGAANGLHRGRRRWC